MNIKAEILEPALFNVCFGYKHSINCFTYLTLNIIIMHSIKISVTWSTIPTSMYISFTLKYYIFMFLYYILLRIILLACTTKRGFCCHVRGCVRMCLLDSLFVWIYQFLIHEKSNIDQTWYKDISWKPLYGHKIKIHISKSSEISG